MIIYGEYLFLENFITGLIILFFTGKIAGERLIPFRLLLCSVCCGVYAFVLFTDLSGLFSLLGKLLFSIVMVTLAFDRKSKKRTLQNAMLFLMVTILYGGIAIALLTSFGWRGITATAGMYLPPMTYLTVMAAATLAAVLLHLLLHLIRAKRAEARMTVETKVFIGQRQWMLRGLIDSGNFLKEPLTGKPVCVVRKTLMEEMLKGLEDYQQRYTAVPYRTVGVEHGILDGYRVDEVMIPGKSVRKAILAVCEETGFFAEESELQILLPESMLERGIYGDFE